MQLRLTQFQLTRTSPSRPTYLAAQCATLLAYSDKPVISTELVQHNCWDNTGSFYTRASAAAADLPLAFFKTLADASRLRLLSVLASGERSVDGLAALLGLRAPTVSHHLARLRSLGLVTLRVDGNVHFYSLDADALRSLSRDVLSVERVASFADDVTAEAWEKKVLRDFFEGERLKEIPASRKNVKSSFGSWRRTSKPGSATPKNR